MDWFLDIATTLVIFAAALLILVFVHELGHFLAAKAFGMRVEKFSIGFPPKIASFTRGETEYSIGATPLGGFVKISGMIDESMDTEFLDKAPEPWEYRSKPVWQRMVVITAGVVFNAILALVIYIGMAFTYGEQVIPLASVPALHVQEGSLAKDVGFRTGDRIIGMNGQPVDTFNELFTPNALMASDLSYRIRRDGQELDLSVPQDFLDRVGREGFLDLSNLIPSVVGGLMEESPASKAGIQVGDRITSINGTPVTHWVEVTRLIQQSESELTLQVDRDGTPFQVGLSKDPDSGIIGITPAENSIPYERVRHGVLASVGEGWTMTGETFSGIIGGLARLVDGSISVRENLGGPVAIASVTRQATESAGLEGFWRITAFLSITLAVMNMLPIPVLDGGHFVFLLYEAVTRREPSVKVRSVLQQIGFALLITLFVLVTFNDLLRAFG